MCDRRLGQHDVGVRSAEAERVDTDRQRRIARVERHVAVDDAQTPAVEIDPGIGRDEVQRSRHRAMLEAQHGLQQAGHAGGRFEVADVGLHRTDQQRTIGRALARHDVDQRTRLDRIADRRAGAVRLEIGERPRIDAGARIHAAQQRRLRGRARHADPARRVADRVHAGAGDHCVDRVAVGQRAIERLEQYERAAFRAHVAVAGRVECAATTARRQHRRLGEADEAERMQQQVDTARERHVGLAGLQCLDGLMESDERRRTGGVDRHARAVQVEQVGHAVRRDAQRIAGCRIRIDHVQIVHVAVAVIHAGRADEDAAVTAAHVGRAHAGILERFPCELEQQALLGVHLGRFARRNAEERGVEAGDVVEHAGRERVALARFAFGRVLVEIGTEAVGRDFGYCVAFVAQELPEVIWIRYAPGETACHPDNCNLAFHYYVVLSSAHEFFKWLRHLCTMCNSNEPNSSALMFLS